MGDRATTIIRVEGRADLYLYRHWGGYKQETVVRSVLARRLRWDDPDYLARMVFSAMVKDDIDEDTGYGIGTASTESEYIRIVLRPDNCTVEFEPSDYGGHNGFPRPPMSFEEFLAADGVTSGEG